MPDRAQAPRFVVVGTGSIGRRHVANLRRLVPDAHITVVKLSAPLDSNSVPPEGADRMVGTLDEAAGLGAKAAIIAGPATMRLPEAGALAAAGCHLMVEKPIGERNEGIEELIDFCRERRLVLMVGYCLRFLPALAALHEIAKSGRVGRVLSLLAEVGQYLPTWRPGRDYRKCVSAQAQLGGGAILELSHEFDYVRWILGEPETVIATCGRLSDLELDVEDCADVILEFPAVGGHPGPRAGIHLDMFQHPACRQCKIIGTEGTAVADLIGGTVRLYHAAAAKWEDLDVARLAQPNDLYLAELRHFLDCVAGEKQAMVDGGDALKTLGVAEAVKLASRTGKAQRIANAP